MADKEEDNNNKNIVTQFKDIATDLLNIEVNTILDKHISAQKMPNVRHALIDIGLEYHAALTEMGLEAMARLCWAPKVPWFWSASRK